MQRKFGIAVVVAIQDTQAKSAPPRPGVRKTSRKRVVAKLPAAA